MERANLTGSLGRRRAIFGALALGAALSAHVPAKADPPAAPKADQPSSPTAEVMIIHATKCDKKSVDPALGDAPPALGYDCLKLLDKKTMPLVLNQPSTTALPNGRTFQLVHSAKVGNRFKVTASISPADGSAGFTKLADITAEGHKAFNVGGFSHQGGVLVLTVRIIP